ncbi:hypothetical protein GCM10011607_12430 [Shewanella inventionis]|uniref:Uncharacterized protein n=1 Tax=Shewanella inventionis TaxID=1738770 RepID=A0ABQ1IYE5_9GAMM|nr:hypothetical protein [Shewanella inventionis]GGB53386.1 hypothetical protein GCM10011607_12430 [Shewanella inventionis]
MLNKPNLDIDSLVEFEKNLVSNTVITMKKLLTIIDEQVCSYPDELVERFAKLLPGGDLSGMVGLKLNQNPFDTYEVFSDEVVDELNQFCDLKLTSDDYCALFGVWLFNEADCEVLESVEYTLDRSNQRTYQSHHVGFADYHHGFRLELQREYGAIELRVCSNDWIFSIGMYLNAFPDFKNKLDELLNVGPLFQMDCPPELAKRDSNAFCGQVCLEDNTVTIYDSNFDDYLLSQVGTLECNLNLAAEYLKKFVDFDLHGTTIVDDFDFLNEFSNAIIRKPFNLIPEKLGVEDTDSIIEIYDRLDYILNSLNEENSEEFYRLKASLTKNYFFDKPLGDYFEEYIAMSNYASVNNLPNLYSNIKPTLAEIKDYENSLLLARNIEASMQDLNITEDEDCSVHTSTLSLNNTL